MQDDEKKSESDSSIFDIKATCTITRGYKLPLAKLTVSGTMNESTESSDINKIVQRAIVFVLDRSGSMSGSRMNMVKQALRPFVEEICYDQNTIIKLVLFHHAVETVPIPNNRIMAANTIDKKVVAGGGTDFHSASKGLVETATSLLEQHPTYQLTVIMCSDGEVGKDNAKRGHSHWKEFVNQQYLKVHKIPPYVETIGISSSHDADVLDGFIVDDQAGNYCKCDTPGTIREAFENAQNETMGRSATKLSIEFPLNVFNDIYSSTKNKEQNKFHLHDLIITSDEFTQNFWISIDEYDKTTAGGDNEWCLIVGGKKVKINVNEVTDSEECQYEAIDFYNQVLKDMLFTLRNITDAEQLKVKAKEIEDELNNDYIKTFELVTAEPVEKQKLQKEIKELLIVPSSEDDNKAGDNTFDGDMDKLVKKRAELMKRYKAMNRLWKKHRTVVTSFQNTLASVKQLVREIILGQVRMQEIRQHILDLHFRKKHAKRISKLVLTDDQLAKRRAVYDLIETPQENDCLDITDEIGTGCYLSTLSKRECVLDGDSLWLCGRVNRSGGAAVSNPELIKIEYISGDLVSDSYFKLAIEAAAGGDYENNKDISRVGFADSSREIINCRLFPIYGNIHHYKSSKPFLHEVLSHTLSGRIDIRVVDYNSLNATIGYMISKNNLTTKNVKRILYEIIPSFRYFTENTYAKPYKSDGTYVREPDSTAARIKLSEKNRYRLMKYVETFKARTTAWVSNASTLFADRLMNLDIDFNAEFYLSLIIQRLRQIFGSQIPKSLDEDELRNKVVANHKKILQVLICGVCNEDRNENDDDEEKTNKEEADDLLVFDKDGRMKKFYELCTIPKMKPIQLSDDDEKLIKEYNVNNITKSMKNMLIQILSRIDYRDLIQANSFFNALSEMPCDIDEDKYGFDEFKKIPHFENIPNDLNILLKDIGFKYNINVLRAICAVSIICHSNRLWQDNLNWFADDKLKQIFKAPQDVLTYIYKTYVIKNIRHDYDVYLENKRIQELIEIHSDPVLPDDIDEHGNLPELRCGWSKCGKVFDNRDKLLDHVRRCIPHAFTHRFHLHCRCVLENNPKLSLKQFSEKALAMFDEKKRKHINQRELTAYYQQFKPIFTKGVTK